MAFGYPDQLVKNPVQSIEVFEHFNAYYTLKLAIFKWQPLDGLQIDHMIRLADNVYANVLDIL